MDTVRVHFAGIEPHHPMLTRFSPSADALSPSVVAKSRLLSALPDDERVRWTQNVTLVNLELGDVLYESGKRTNHVYFPIGAIVSLLYVTEDGHSAEIAVVGNEGVVGIAIFMGGGSCTGRAVVQRAGYALRIPARFITEEFERSGIVLELMLRYTQALITQTGQIAVCNKHHSIDQQLCRWLLLSLDRLDSNVILMTQELIANMLGVRREGVAEAAVKLQRAGLISYVRGRITVLDRIGLENRSCECYLVVKHEYERLLAQPVITGRLRTRIS